MIALLVISVGWALIITLQPYIVKKVIDTVMKISGPALFSKLIWLIGSYVFLGLGLVSLNFFYDSIVVLFFPEQKKTHHAEVNAANAASSCVVLSKTVCRKFDE